MNEEDGILVDEYLTSGGFITMVEEDEDGNQLGLTGGLGKLLNNPLTRTIGMSILSGGTLTGPALEKELAKQKKQQADREREAALKVERQNAINQLEEKQANCEAKEKKLLKSVFCVEADIRSY